MNLRSRSNGGYVTVPADLGEKLIAGGGWYDADAVEPEPDKPKRAPRGSRAKKEDTTEEE